MKFNVRSALAAVGSMAEGRLLGEVQAQQEQQQQDQANFQRQFALAQLDQGTLDRENTAAFGGLKYVDPSAQGGAFSDLLAATRHGPPSEEIGRRLGEGAAGRLHIPYNPSPGGEYPAGATGVAGLPASSGVTGTGSSLTPAPGATQPYETASPFMGVGESVLKMLGTHMPFGIGGQIQQSLFGAGQPPPAPTQPAGQPPVAISGPGDVGGAQPPRQPLQLPFSNLNQQVRQLMPSPLEAPPPPPPPPAPGPVEPEDTVSFPQVPGKKYPSVSVTDKDLRLVFNEMNKVATALGQIDLAGNPNATEILYTLGHLPGYETGRTPEGRAYIQQTTSKMRALLAGQQKTPTPGQAAAGERAKTQEKHRQNTDLLNALKDVAPNAPIKVIKHIIHRQGLDDDFVGMNDTEIRQELMGGKISEATTKIRQLLSNASHTSPGEMADLVSQLNGLKGLMQPGAFKVPMSEYLKLSKLDQDRLLSTDMLRIDRHQAALNKQKLFPREQERLQVAIDEARARIKHLDQAGGGTKKGGLSAVARLRASAKAVDDAATDLRSTLSRPEYAGFEAKVRPFVEAHFGDWLDQNNSTMPSKEWENSPELGSPGISRDQKIVLINKMLRKHQARVQLDEKQVELEKEAGGASQGAPGSGQHWPGGYDVKKADNVYLHLLQKGLSPAEARNQVLSNPTKFGAR